MYTDVLLCLSYVHLYSRTSVCVEITSFVVHVASICIHGLKYFHAWKPLKPQYVGGFGKGMHCWFKQCCWDCDLCQEITLVQVPPVTTTKMNCSRLLAALWNVFAVSNVIPRYISVASSVATHGFFFLALELVFIEVRSTCKKKLDVTVREKR